MEMFLGFDWFSMHDIQYDKDSVIACAGFTPLERTSTKYCKVQSHSNLAKDRIKTDIRSWKKELGSVPAKEVFVKANLQMQLVFVM